ncbi:hypothetical protein [Candidatus Magnetobacterium casense]|uniref:Uncharacterized protein n=1 Tax=Candidatus Magnetobacterium casense TaxID=1455061 RepID=A0ABS6S2T8_9BACT|nr:hypothetical protein [Candidatus Magnetobacterium casensis]MBV6342952.1 hypothetical protein [Candidatus Magnetobacterium casensis]
MSAERIVQALDFSRQFASTQESRDRKICVCEVLDGVFYSTDRVTAAAVTVRGLEASKMRIHIKDASGVISFLGTCGQDNVTVLEHRRAVLFRRGDGALFGASRFEDAFRPFGRPGDDQNVWKFSVGDMRTVIGVLRSGAAKEDKRLLLEREADGPLRMGMWTKRGKQTIIPIPCTGETIQAEAPPLPKGFMVNCESLDKILALAKVDNVEVGVNVRNNSGYLRFVSRRFGDEAKSDSQDEYLVVLAWLRELGA